MSDRPLVAVLGGGQLGRMLGMAGADLGVDLRFLDPSPDATAQAFGPLVVGELGDEAALARVAAGADVVTYEWEGVPAAGARFVASSVTRAAAPGGARRRAGPRHREADVRAARHRRGALRADRRTAATSTAAIERRRAAGGR